MESVADTAVHVLEVDIAADDARERWAQTRQDRGALRMSRAASSPAERITGAMGALSKSGLQAAMVPLQFNICRRMRDGCIAAVADVANEGHGPKRSCPTCVVLPPLLLLLKEAKFSTEEPDEVQRRDLGDGGRRRKDVA